MLAGPDRRQCPALGPTERLWQRPRASTITSVACCWQLAVGSPEAEDEFRAAIFSPVNGYSRTNTELAQVLLQLKRPLDAAALAESALRGPFDGPNTYVTRTELFELAGARLRCGR